MIRDAVISCLPRLSASILVDAVRVQIGDLAARAIADAIMELFGESADAATRLTPRQAAEAMAAALKPLTYSQGEDYRPLPLASVHAQMDDALLQIDMGAALMHPELGQFIAADWTTYLEGILCGVGGDDGGSYRPELIDIQDQDGSPSVSLAIRFEDGYLFVNYGQTPDPRKTSCIVRFPAEAVHRVGLIVREDATDPAAGQEAIRRLSAVPLTGVQ